MKTYFISLYLLLSSSFLFAQDFEWVRQLGSTNSNHGASITTDNKGNVYTTGSYVGVSDFDPSLDTFNLSSQGSNDIFIHKMNPSGQLVWVKSIGSTSNDIGLTITNDALGNVLVSGLFTGTVDFDPGTGVYNLTASGATDVFILKLDVNGNFLWAKRIGGGDFEKGTAIAVGQNNHIYLTGTFKTGPLTSPPNLPLVSNGGDDIFIIKMDSNGNVVWVRAMGGSHDELSTGLVLDEEDNIYTTGSFYTTADFDPSATVFNLTSNGDKEIFIHKLDSAGNFVWAKQIGGFEKDQANDIGLDLDGNVYITGYYERQVDFDPGAGTYYKTAVGNKDIFVLKLLTNGDFDWVTTMGGLFWMDEGAAIVVDSSKQVYIAGVFVDTMDVDPGVGTVYLQSVGDRDIFLQKLDSNGQLVWAHNFGSVSFDWANSIALYKDQYLYTLGQYNGTTDFDPSPNVASMTPVGWTPIFVQKLDVSTTTIPTHIITTPTALLYPNPSSGFITIELETIQETTITVLDAQGKSVATPQTTQQSIHQLDLSFLPSGLYYISIVTDKSSSIVKWVKE